MKNIMKPFTVTLFAAVILCIASCTKQDDNYPFPSGGDSNGGETPEVSASIPRLIREHVKVTASYYDYKITASLTSTLEEALPDRSIKYGVEYGYLREDEADDVLDNKLYLSKYGNTYSDEFLIFYYANKYEWPFSTSCTFFYDTYAYYQNLFQSGEVLTGDDLDSYNECCAILEDGEQKAARAFTGRFFVEVDGVKYNYKYMYFDFWPNLHLDIDN